MKRNVRLRCPFRKGTCEITRKTRRQCQACRLRKCLESGMKKESEWWLWLGGWGQLPESRGVTVPKRMRVCEPVGLEQYRAPVLCYGKHRGRCRSGLCPLFPLSCPCMTLLFPVITVVLEVYGGWGRGMILPGHICRVLFVNTQ